MYFFFPILILFCSDQIFSFRLSLPFTNGRLEQYVATHYLSNGTPPQPSTWNAQSETFNKSNLLYECLVKVEWVMPDMSELATADPTIHIAF